MTSIVNWVTENDANVPLVCVTGYSSGFYSHGFRVDGLRGRQRQGGNRDHRRRPVRMHGTELAGAFPNPDWQPPGKYQVSVADYLLRSAQLAREFSKALKHDVRVRTVIAVPGWEIEDQSNALCLAVNERNLVMLRGWKDPNDYLMNEDVEALHELLGQRCTA